MTSCAAVALPVGPVPARAGSRFGYRNTRSGRDFHGGLDIHAPAGTPVRAVTDGTLVDVYPSGALNRYGHTVVLKHGPGLYSLSAHLDAVGALPPRGGPVIAGDVIGTVGTTAGTRAQPSARFKRSRPHLHLEFLRRWPPAARDADRIDPAPVLAELGIIVPPEGPLALACEAEDLPAPPGRYPIRRPQRGPEAFSAPRSGGGGALLLIALLWAMHARRN